MPKIDYGITFCRVPDLAATQMFCEDQLGLPLLLAQAECVIYKVSEQCAWGFCQAQESLPAEPLPVLTFVTDEVDEWYSYLIQRGVLVDGPSRKNELYRIYHFYAETPGGWRLEVQSFFDPRWKSA